MADFTYNGGVGKKRIPIVVRVGNNVHKGQREFAERVRKHFDDNQPLGYNFEGSASTKFNNAFNNSDMEQLDFHPFSLNQDMNHNQVGHNSDLIGQVDLYQDLGHNTEIKHSESNQFSIEGFDCSQFFGAEDTVHHGQNIIPNILPNICPPPSAFLAPKCALWDCFGPAQGVEWCRNYYSSCHELLANNEGLSITTRKITVIYD
ncbi:hypothetical protein VIGAN_04080800 [Vigna angularis var. angularis]|uniref:Uncharacterized protein n=1 Tax=Vigna angularis var. angularis TaxID=157739 RepID=A0A0S3RSU6_PHAAN|nr:hypothetical protein VIGAN_04080800 [Vigna angularis var. angularis]